jgi:hypothetical protein
MPSGPEQAARNAEVDKLFLEFLDRAMARGENLSGSRTANNYAPNAFARIPEARKAHIGRDQFMDALDRLIGTGRVVAEPYGPPSKLAKRIVRGGAA